MIKILNNKKMDIHPDTFIAESSDIIGEVTLKEGANIWYGAVLRGDINKIEIGKYTNIQDNASLHNDSNNPLIIGNYTTVGHNAVVHGCTVGDSCLIGMGAILLNGAVIEDNCLIGAGAIITEGMYIPKNSLVLGAPAKVRRLLSEEEIRGIKDNATSYYNLWKENYKKTF